MTDFSIYLDQNINTLNQRAAPGAMGSSQSVGGFQNPERFGRNYTGLSLHTAATSMKSFSEK